MPSPKTGVQTGSRPSAAEGGGAPAPALSPSDRRSTPDPVALTKEGEATKHSSGEMSREDASLCQPFNDGLVPRTLRSTQ